MKYFVIFLLFTFSTPAFAGFHVGTSLMAVGSYNKSPSYNLGYSKLIKGLSFDLTTNALFPTRNEFNKRGYAVESKVTYGTVLIGKQIGQFVLSPLASLVKVDNKIYYGNMKVKDDTNYAVIFGGNVTYFLSNKVAVTLFGLRKNPKVGLKHSVGFGVNIYF